MSRIHKRGVLSGYTADEAVGITVNSLMFRKRLTRVELGRALGVTPAAAGRKLRGEIGWSIGDLFHVAEFLGVEVSTLLPARGRKIPANPEADGELVAGTGFEPVTSGRRRGRRDYFGPGSEATDSHGVVRDAPSRPISGYPPGTE